MIENSSRRREGMLFRLGESVREVTAAWFVLFFVVAAGLSILGIYRSSLVDCTTIVSIPGCITALPPSMSGTIPPAPSGLAATRNRRRKSTPTTCKLPVMRRQSIQAAARQCQGVQIAPTKMSVYADVSVICCEGA
jgi:hypothetical protein